MSEKVIHIKSSKHAFMGLKQFNYKEIWFLQESGIIVMVITKENKLICVDKYVNLMRSEKLKKIENIVND